MSKNNNSEKREGQPSIRRHGPGMMGAIEKPKDTRGALNRLLGYLGEYRLSLALVIVLTTVSYTHLRAHET